MICLCKEKTSFQMSASIIEYPHNFKPYSALNVAEQFLKLANEQARVLTPMQLIKLVYLAHAWMLAFYQRPLIREGVEAWKYGPVIPELYEAIKQFRSNPVTHVACDQQKFDEKSLDIIQQVYAQYGHFNGIELSTITHEKDSPWDIAWKNEHPLISNDLITHYYQKLAHDVSCA